VMVARGLGTTDNGPCRLMIGGPSRI